MRIVNPEVRRRLDAGEPIGLDLGSGGAGADGCFGVDLAELPGVDIVASLEHGLPDLPDGSVSRIRSRHCLEHIDDLDGVLREILRVATPDADIEIVVPHFSNPYFFSDPTHRRAFGLYTFAYYAPDQSGLPRRVPRYATDIAFRVERVAIEFYLGRAPGRWFRRAFRWWVNRSPANQDRYERWAWWRPAHQIRYRLRPASPSPIGQETPVPPSPQ